MLRRSYKGSHLALLVELLAGPLVGGAVADKLAARNWGNLVLAIDPAAVTGDGAVVRRDAAALLQRVRDARPLPGSAGPALPGQRSDSLAGECRTSASTTVWGACRATLDAIAMLLRQSANLSALPLAPACWFTITPAQSVTS